MNSAADAESCCFWGREFHTVEKGDAMGSDLSFQALLFLAFFLLDSNMHGLTGRRWLCLVKRHVRCDRVGF